MNHEGEIVFAELSADGKRVLTAGGDQVARVWDADTGKPLTRIATGDPIHSAALSPDGTKVVTGGSRDSATVWDAASGRKLIVLDAPAGYYNADKTPSPVAFLVFSPDGGNILGLRATCGLYIWDAQSGRQLVSRSFDNGPLDIDGTSSARPAAFSKDGRRAISTDLLAFTVWDVTTGRGLGGAGGETARFLGGPQAVAFNTAGVYDAQSGDQILCIGRDMREVPHVAYSPAGTHVAATFPSDDYTTLWRVPDR